MKQAKNESSFKKDITKTEIKSQSDEMKKLLNEGGFQNDLENLFPDVCGTLSRVESDLTEFFLGELGVAFHLWSSCLVRWEELRG